MALRAALRSILLQLPHRWLPAGAAARAKLRNADFAELISGEALRQLDQVAISVLADFEIADMNAFPEDPGDAACLVGAMLHLALRGGLPHDHSYVYELVVLLRELEEKARTAFRHDNAEAGGRAARKRGRENPLRRLAEDVLRSAAPETPTRVLVNRLLRATKGKSLSAEAARKLIDRARAELHPAEQILGQT